MLTFDPPKREPDASDRESEVDDLDFLPQQRRTASPAVISSAKKLPTPISEGEYGVTVRTPVKKTRRSSTTADSTGSRKRRAIVSESVPSKSEIGIHEIDASPSRSPVTKQRRGISTASSKAPSITVTPTAKRRSSSGITPQRKPSTSETPNALSTPKASTSKRKLDEPELHSPTTNVTPIVTRKAPAPTSPRRKVANPETESEDADEESKPDVPPIVSRPLETPVPISPKGKERNVEKSPKPSPAAVDEQPDVQAFLTTLPLASMLDLYPLFESFGCTTAKDLLALADESDPGVRSRKAMLDQLEKGAEGLKMTRWQRIVLEAGLDDFSKRRNLK